MAKLRICAVCGTQYKYCRDCNSHNADETWRFLFHDQNCKTIYEIWDGYRSGQLTKDSAAKALKSFDMTTILKSGSYVVDLLKEILDIKDEPEKEEVVEPVEEKKVEDVKEEAKDEEPKADEFKSENRFQKHGYKNNKK